MICKGSRFYIHAENKNSNQIFIGFVNLVLTRKQW